MTGSRLTGQIGFLSEWQMYAQKLEGSSWREDIMDKTKIDKMSGECEILMLSDASDAVQISSWSSCTS
jgi:hypothetical protein